MKKPYLLLLLAVAFSAGAQPNQEYIYELPSALTGVLKSRIIHDPESSHSAEWRGLVLDKPINISPIEKQSDTSSTVTVAFRQTNVKVVDLFISDSQWDSQWKKYRKFKNKHVKVWCIPYPRDPVYRFYTVGEISCDVKHIMEIKNLKGK